MALTRYDQYAGGWVRWQQTDEEAREWARDYGGNDSWYWSPKWQAMTSITDGVTTVADVGDALARGDDSPEIARLAADYWLMVGQHVYTDALMASGRVRWPPEADEDGYYPQPTADEAVVIAEADAKAAEIGRIVEELAGTSREAWSAGTAAQDAAEAAERLDMSEVRAVYDLLYDPAYYAEIEGDGAREDNYCDRIWEAAETYVAAGHTVVDMRAQRSTDHAASQAAAGEGKSQDTAYAELFDQLDQARAQLEAGDVPAEREHHHADYIEYLEQEVAHAADTAAGEAAGKSADEVLAELIADLDSTPPDTYPGDEAYQEQLAREARAAAHAAIWGPPDMTDGEFRMEAPNIDEATGMTAAQLRGDTPDTLPATTSAWLATEAAGCTDLQRSAHPSNAPDDEADTRRERGDWVTELPVSEACPNPGVKAAWLAGVARREAAAEDSAESPGKPRCADAVSAAHAAVHADARRATEELDEQQHRPHASNAAELTDVVEQAPTMERGA